MQNISSISLRLFPGNISVFDNISVYGSLIIICLFLLKVFIDSFISTIFSILFYVVYFRVEERFLIEIYAYFDPKTFKKNRKTFFGMLVLPFLYIISFIFTFFTAEIPNTKNFISTYVLATSVSGLILLTSSFVKCLFFCLDLISHKSFQKGILGLIQRFFSIAKSVFVTYFWLNYLNFGSKYSVLVCIYNRENWVLLTYTVFKCFYLIIVILDFYFALGTYSQDMFFSIVDEEVDGMCSICLQEIKDPVRTQCSHIFCIDCLKTWIYHNNYCPYCRATFSNQKMEFYNGRLPVSASVCSF